jgi:hypothetical protein
MTPEDASFKVFHSFFHNPVEKAVELKVKL